MYLITFTTLNQTERTITVCAGSLLNASRLFGILSTTNNMMNVEVVNKDGVTVRSWDYKEGYKNS